MYPFRMYGRIIEVLRYAVSYTEDMPGEGGELVPTAQTELCATLEEANEVAAQYPGATVAPVDNNAYEWMDGIEVPDVKDTFAEAVKIYDMGQEAYLQKVAAEASERNIQLRADIDFLAAMQGVDL